MKTSTKQNYRKRLIKVIDYIYQNIDGDLSVNALADIAMMSPYHFHRIYREIAQENINTAVRRLRLQSAASDLIRSDKPLKHIAKKVSYGSIEAFSRAFSKEFGETPSEYRAARTLQRFEKDNFVAMLPLSEQEFITMYDVEITKIEAIDLIGYEHQGDYMDIGSAFSKLFQYAYSQALITEQTRSIGIYYNDPKSVDTKDLRAAACITKPVSKLIEKDAALKDFSIPGGKCARLVFKGSYAELEKPYDWLFGHWLPNSGYEAANFPPFEEYINDPKTTPQSELLTRIHCLLA